MEGQTFKKIQYKVNSVKIEIYARYQGGRKTSGLFRLAVKVGKGTLHKKMHDGSIKRGEGVCQAEWR